MELLKLDYKRRRRRSWDRAERSIARLRTSFGMLPASAITRRTVAEYIAKREGSGAAGRVRVPEGMLRLAWADGALRSMPVFPSLPAPPRSCERNPTHRGKSKTGDSRVFPFGTSPSLARAIKARYLISVEGSVYVFERPVGQPMKDFKGAWAKA